MPLYFFQDTMFSVLNSKSVFNLPLWKDVIKDIYIRIVVAQGRTTHSRKPKHSQAWSSNGWVTELGFEPALRFLLSQILCILYKIPPGETILYHSSC